MSEAFQDYFPQIDRRQEDYGPYAAGLLHDRRHLPELAAARTELLGSSDVQQFASSTLLNFDSPAVVSPFPNINFIGITALGNAVFDEPLHRAVGRLRADVYIDEEGFLSPEHRRPDGTESDSDDSRSIHIAIAKANGVDPVTILGGERLVKKNSSEPLPVEQDFDIDVLPENALEVSRFIARNNNRRVQAATSLALMRVACFLAIYEGAPSVTAIVEAPLYRLFNIIGLPFNQVAEARWLEEYQSNNMAIQLDPTTILKSLHEKDRNRKPESAVAPFFERAKHNLGLGFYGDSF